MRATLSRAVPWGTVGGRMDVADEGVDQDQCEQRGAERGQVLPAQGEAPRSG